MGGKLTVGGGAIALVFLSATRALSGPSAQQINAAVKACIEVARAHGDPDFDAYFNTATGSVQYNASYANTQFAFQKCMAERGLPLGKRKGGE
jgi:hypothetical protein